MYIEHLNENGKDIAVVSSDERSIVDAYSALELAIQIKYEANATRIVLDKALFSEEFFDLSTGIAGAVLQKFVNYHIKAAIYGDFSRYTSKPLRDFIHESNHGNDFFFVSTREEAIRRLAEAL